MGTGQGLQPAGRQTGTACARQRPCGSITQGRIRPTGTDTGMKMLPPARAARRPGRQGTGLAARIRSTPVPGDDPARAAGPAGLQPGGLAMTNQRQEKSRQPAACCVVTGFLLKWWAPRESNPAPTDYAYQLWLSPPLSGLWSGLSLVFTTCPYSLYTFSLARASLGIATPPGRQRFPRI